MLLGGVLIGSLVVAIRSAHLVEGVQVDLMGVGFIWGLAFTMWAVAFMASIAYRVGAAMVGARGPGFPVVQPPPVEPMAPAGPMSRPAPEGSPSFVDYDESQDGMADVVEQARAAGVDEENIEEFLAKYGRTQESE